mmetsp:Transcript_23902/g.71713  ORF Transcript_23902/g.71713 Transcript_23902/m.71713 type:complete len:121 (-) Transcript_23902:25-387(-)
MRVKEVINVADDSVSAKTMCGNFTASADAMKAINVALEDGGKKVEEVIKNEKDDDREKGLRAAVVLVVLILRSSFTNTNRRVKLTGRKRDAQDKLSKMRAKTYKQTEALMPDMEADDDEE